MLFEMRFENGQLLMSFFPEFVFIILVPIFLVAEIVVVKIALKLAKAQERKGFKWVILSVFIQIGFFAFVAMPFLFFGMMGLFSGSSNGNGGGISTGALMSMLMPLLLFAMILDIGIINILHKIGPRRSLGVFIMMVIPMVILGAYIGTMMSGGFQYSSPGPTGGMGF
jgi:hypothetical protein